MRRLERSGKEDDAPSVLGDPFNSGGDGSRRGGPYQKDTVDVPQARIQGLGSGQVAAAQRENVLVFAVRYTEKEHGQLTARNHYGIRVMDRIAKETGGTHIDAETTDPHTYFRQIADELRTSYDLGYYPTNPQAQADDTFRKLVIRPKQAGLTVRAKTGYFTHPSQ